MTYITSKANLDQPSQTQTGLCQTQKIVGSIEAMEKTRK
jgi:hypothetical protein